MVGGGQNVFQVFLWQSQNAHALTAKNHVTNTYNTGCQSFKAIVSRQASHRTCRLRRKRFLVAQYVGERGSNASQYHDSDFDWNICVEEGRMAVARQRAEYAQLQQQKSTLVQQQPNVPKNQDQDDSDEDESYSDKWESFMGSIQQVDSSRRRDI
eukprot:jgi/Picre1/35785/NNA_003245.t1